MSEEDKVLRLAEKNHGIIYSRELRDREIGRWVLQDMEKNGIISPVQRGIYVTEDAYVDDFFYFSIAIQKGFFLMKRLSSFTDTQAVCHNK